MAAHHDDFSYGLYRKIKCFAAQPPWTLELEGLMGGFERKDRQTVRSLSDHRFGTGVAQFQKQRVHVSTSYRD